MSIASPNENSLLDELAIDLFSLDRRVEPVEDLAGVDMSGLCTDDGCSRDDSAC